jgi:hypothetical protein
LMSQVAGSPSTSKNFVVGENESGIFTAHSTTQTPNNQSVPAPPTTPAR